ncbi:MAG: hypothetical protein ACR2HP_12960 [Ilumatobacteraceae bacterium]
MISRHQAIGENVPYPPATVGAARERLMSGDFDHVGGHHLVEITPDEVIVGVPFTDRRRAIAARTVVIVTYNHPNRELAEHLAADSLGTSTVHLVGDVNGTNGIRPAIHQAAQAARAI